MIEYVGLFIDNEGVKELIKNEKNRHEKLPKSFHLTLEYRPKDESIYEEIINKTFKVKIVGYGSDENNSGFLVELPKKLGKYYKNTDKNGKIKPAHITMSLSPNGKAVNTANLNFTPIDPFYVTGEVRYFEIKNKLGK